MRKGNIIFRFHERFFKKMSFAEKTELEKQQVNDRYRYICVRQVEDRTEEVVVGIDQESEQAGHTVPLEKREIEHIDHFAHHERGVVTAQMGDGRGGTGRKDHSVEGAVEDVAQCSGEDQGHSDDDAFRCASFYEAVNQIPQHADHGDAEHA